MASEQLDLNRFNEIIDEYSSQFKNPPKNARHLVQFCKDRSYNYKYGELNPFFSVWYKQQKRKKSKITKGNNSNASTPAPQVDWDEFWNEYQTKYKYPPKKAIHLWNFAKEEKFVSVKYKEARVAFDRINRMKMNEKNKNDNVKEGHTTQTKTNNGSKTSNDNENVLVLKVTKYTSDDELAFIKEKFLELLSAFRRSILHDPANPLQLFNFINEDTKYKVRYGDVKKCYNYAVKHKWFKPMRRMRKVKKKKKKKKLTVPTTETIEGSDNDKNNNEGEQQNEFVLEIDHETIEKEKLKEEEKKEIIVNVVMTDEQFDIMLYKYNIKYNNPPRNASQIMNFAHEVGEKYKYKACRIAFNRWDRLRGRKMPEKESEKEVEPGHNVQQENENSD